ncbi:MAG: hypothetical protein K0S07_234 [Chlamydiales bacterium]|jgi:hypothetical protein|nr:hypothetical protein [Chlamydiales bacterium]
MNIGNPSYPFLLKISSLIDEAAQQEGSQLSSLFANWDGAKEPEYSMPRVLSLQAAALKQAIKLDNPHIQYLADLPSDRQGLALKAAGSFEHFLQLIPHLSKDGIRYLSIEHLKELGADLPGKEVKTKKVFKLFLRMVYDQLLIELKAQEQPSQGLKEIVEISYQTPLSPRSRSFGRSLLYKVEKVIKKVIPIIKAQSFKLAAALAVGSIVMFTCTYTMLEVYYESYPYLQGLVEKILGDGISYFYAFCVVRSKVALYAYLIQRVVILLPLPNRYHVILVNSLSWVCNICLCDAILLRKSISYIYHHIAAPAFRGTRGSIDEAALSAEEQLARRFYWQLEVAKKQWGAFVAQLAEPQLA